MSERLLHKNCDRKGSVAKKISGREPQSAWRQDELTGSRPPVVKLTLTLIRPSLHLHKTRKRNHPELEVSTHPVTL
jgi:hypothetical protein